jgi:hypothetical protein
MSKLKDLEWLFNERHRSPQAIVWNSGRIAPKVRLTPKPRQPARQSEGLVARRAASVYAPSHLALCESGPREIRGDLLIVIGARLSRGG